MDVIPDKAAREAAETTFDRNVVVVAGAGTGKTTLLVNRVVHLLVKEPKPVAITQIVALTFTNKAATEMKMRLRERLTVLTQPESEHSSTADGGVVSIRDLRSRYGLPADAIASRAEAALRDLEKAQIGTLHSFAAHLLRLHPLESRVDPSFQEDEGLRFNEHFTMAWDLWIDRELSRQGTRHSAWRALLNAASLEELCQLTRSLCSELIDLDAIQQQIEAGQVTPLVQAWLTSTAARAQALLHAHDRTKRRKIEQMLAATATLLQLVATQGANAIPQVSEVDRNWLGKDPGSPVDGWEKKSFGEAVSLINVAQQLLAVDHKFFKNILSLISGLVSDIRSSFAQKGWLSFDGLLARARMLLRDHPAVRERIKRDYLAVLVDEFQDTDPVQYEIILAVSEQQGRHATDWHAMALEPGKLFIVGDPKQSIYAFRRADIEAFDRVVQKIESDGGVVHTLTTNFRSDAAVLGPINDLFDRLFVRQPLVQPDNVRLEVRPQRRPAAIEPGVRLQIAAPKGGEGAFDAAGATRAEGEVLARWIKEDLLSRPHTKAGHIALLFWKLTQADSYLDALRRYRVPYVIEGEKHFYRRQEVIDFINLLRVLDRPHDHVALAGVMRSPLGGLTDRELYDLRQVGGFDYLHLHWMDSWSHPRTAAVRRFYEHLAWLHSVVAECPLADALELIFDRLPILDLAAASLHGEQAVANLLKVKQTAAALSDRPHMTLSGFVEEMVTRLDEQPEEAETPLAEDSSDAVHILTIHKAKGLEFPIVVLPGLHQGSGRERAIPQVTYDWSSNSYGLSLGDRLTFGSVLVRDKLASRVEAERRRVLYVGMTRAKELLLLSGGVTTRAGGESVLGLLASIGTGEMGLATTASLLIGASAIPHRVIEAPDRFWPRRTLTKSSGTAAIDVPSIATLWRDREARWSTARATPLRTTPTRLDKQTLRLGDAHSDKGQHPAVGRLVGVLAHRILERWNFSSDPNQLCEQIDPIMETVPDAEMQDLAPAIRESLQELCLAFGQSETYSRLRSASILGREIPFMMPWEDGQVMEGIIDLIYRLDGRLRIADYKTDLVTKKEAVMRAETYRAQLSCYRAAVLQSLGEPVASCDVIFLRPGLTITLEGGS